MRVLGFAEKRFDRAALTIEDCAQGFEFTGLQCRRRMNTPQYCRLNIPQFDR
jgi:hypothetical protein